MFMRLRALISVPVNCRYSKEGLNAAFLMRRSLRLSDNSFFSLLENTPIITVRNRTIPIITEQHRQEPVDDNENGNSGLPITRRPTDTRQ